MKETLQTHVFNNHSVKILDIRRYFPCSLSLFWYFIANETLIFFVFLVIRFLFKLVRDKVRLNVEYISTSDGFVNVLTKGRMLNIIFYRRSCVRLL